MTARPSIVRQEAAPDDPILPTLLRVLKLTRAFQNLRLAEIGLQNGQDEFLLVLDGSRSKCVCDIANELGVRASTISKMVDVLHSKGLVERAKSEQDNRRIVVYLTAAGMEMRQAVRDVWINLDNELIRSAATLDTLSLQRDLRVLEEHVGRRLARLR